MIDYKFGDIMLVPFPFTDQTKTKKRPAVIVSSNAYNQNRPDIVIMAVTSQSHGSGYFGDIRIQKWQQASLLKPSLLRFLPFVLCCGAQIVKGRIGIGRRYYYCPICGK